MKQPIKIALFSLLSFFTISLQAQYYSNTVDTFDELILSGNIEVLLEKGEEESVSVKSEKEKLNVYVERGVLRVKRKKPLRIKEYQAHPIQVTVTYKVLRRVKANAGADVTNKQVLTGDQLTLDFNSGSGGNLDVDVNDVHISVSEGSQLRVTGKTVSQESKVSTGAELSAFRLNSERTYIKANTGAHAKVMATQAIDAIASTGGDINYKGEPGKVKIKDHLGGNVSGR